MQPARQNEMAFEQRARFLEFVQNLFDVHCTSLTLRLLGLAHAVDRFDRIVHP